MIYLSRPLSVAPRGVGSQLFSSSSLLRKNESVSELFGSSTIVLVGPPGSGKGTYGKMLAKHLSGLRKHSVPWDMVTASDILKQNAEFKRDYVDKGRLGSDDVVTGFVADFVVSNYGRSSSASPNNLILDGFPRTTGQLDNMINDQSSFAINGVSLALMVVIDLPDWVCETKMGGRVECKFCGSGFNVASVEEGGYDMPAILPPKDPATCRGRACGSMLNESEWIKPRRSDDVDPNILKRRLETYRDTTHKVVGHYLDRGGNTVVFDPKNGIDDFHILAEKVVEQLNFSRQ